ncbi:MAG TPA: lipid-A-disaccharide synthase, partial [Blastocatellia bacterium]|nr:lipid-A-disaccharide synthase [Blastocatellia bacterium]
MLISTGEASGDAHGARLLEALRRKRPALSAFGMGGTRLAAAGLDRLVSSETLSVVGISEVVEKIPSLRRALRRLRDGGRERRPEAAILIDFPDFHSLLGRALQRAGIPLIYYVSPQVWAWQRGRIKKMARFIDLVLCIFPFEADLYAASGLRAVFVGHPMIERLEIQKIGVRRDPNLIGLFPGSRSREVRKILPVMIEAARRLLESNPTLRFQVAAASEELAREMREMLTSHLNPLPSGRGEAKSHRKPNESARVGSEQSNDRQAIEITIGETAAIMQRAFVGIVASGSATLEAAYFGMPFVLIYKVAWPTYV